MNCEGWSNEAELGRSSNQWQDGSHVGRGSIGVAVSCLGMRHPQLTETSLQLCEMGGDVGSEMGLSRMVVA